VNCDMKPLVVSGSAEGGGLQVRGMAGRTNASEPLLMPRERRSETGRDTGVAGTGLLQGGRRRLRDSQWPCRHRRPRGIEGARLRPRLTRAEHGNPARVRYHILRSGERMCAAPVPKALGGTRKTIVRSGNQDLFRTDRGACFPQASQSVRDRPVAGRCSPCDAVHVDGVLRQGPVHARRMSGPADDVYLGSAAWRRVV
jgi:hypothetical protein